MKNFVLYQRGPYFKIYNNDRYTSYLYSIANTFKSVYNGSFGGSVPSPGQGIIIAEADSLEELQNKVAYLFL